MIFNIRLSIRLNTKLNISKQVCIYIESTLFTQAQTKVCKKICLNGGKK